ncbi:hypothetical protein ACSSS7_003304 [Eimeria intestinalis]
MASRFFIRSRLLGSDGECSSVASDGAQFASGDPSLASSSNAFVDRGHPAGGDVNAAQYQQPQGVFQHASEGCEERAPKAPVEEDIETSDAWHSPISASPSSDLADCFSASTGEASTFTAAHDSGDGVVQFGKNSWKGPWGAATKKAAVSAAAAATATASAATDRLMMMHLFISRLLAAGTRGLPDKSSKDTEHDSGGGAAESSGVSMAFHQRGRASELLQYHFMILILAVTVAFGTQNALAPNLSRIAETFHFSETERDLRIGGTLAFLYYAPGCVGALAVGLCAGVLDRNKLLSAVLLLAGFASFCTFFVNAYWQLAVLRLLAGLASGGVHPLAYSLVGDWFGPSLRACASAFVLGAAGFGTFCGQCLAALLGSLDWRWVFLILAAPLLFMAHFYHLANGRLGGAPPQHLEFGGAREQQELTFQGLKGMAKSKTNILMLMQAFPGNVPWGVLVVYLHDFLRTDVGLSDNIAIAAIVAVAAASFCGMLVGGIIGGQLYAQSGRKLLRFCAATCVLRCVPCVLIFAFPAVVGKSPEGPALLLLLVLLLTAAFGSTLPTANIGAVLLNVNTAEVRGTICAIYTVLDDISKAMGTVIALWLLSAAALLAASVTYAADEARVMEAERHGAGAGFRQLSDEGVHDCLPLLLKQQQVQQCEGLSAAHPAVHQPNDEIMDVHLRLSKSSDGACGTVSGDSAAGLWEQFGQNGNYSQHRSRL